MKSLTDFTRHLEVLRSHSRDSEMDRKKLEALAWRHTHRDSRGVGDDGVRRVLHRNPATGRTELLLLSSFTDAQLIGKLPASARARLAKPAPTTYPFVTRRQIQARIESEPAFMKESAHTLQARTEQRVVGAAAPGKPWGWMSSERVVAARLVEKASIGMLSPDDEAKLAKLVIRYSRQLADHYRATAIQENPALSEAAAKFGVLPMGFDPPDIVQTPPEPKETAEQCHPEPDCEADDLEDDSNVDSETVCRRW